MIDLLPIDDEAKDIAGQIIDYGNGQDAAAAYVRSSDFTSHSGHEQTGVEAAYRAGLFGDGVVVAIVDDGVSSSNSEFASRMLAGFNANSGAANGDPVVNNDCAGYGGCDTGRHGTLMAGVIGAANDGTGAHGVAPGVRMFSLNVDTGADEGAFSSAELSSERGFAAALGSGARIFNHSYAVTFDAALQPYFESGANGTYDRIREVMAAGGINVFAAGNDGTDQPSMEALWPLWKTDLAGGVIAATGVVRDADTGELRLASYANKCGQAQEWCLAAPTGDFGSGAQFTGLVPVGADGTYSVFEDPDQNGLTDTVGGTSTAAAYISGALALLEEAFPNLTGEELGVILLDTASDLGTAGTDATYGRGVVDIEEAILPQGTASVASGATLSDTLTPLSDTQLSLGSTMAGANPLRGKTMVFFDSYGRAYAMDAQALASANAPYRDGLGRLGDTLDTMASRTREAEQAQRGWSFGISAPSHGATQRGAADAGSLMMLVMQDKDGTIRAVGRDHFDAGFMALSPDVAASVLRYALSPNSSLSVTMGSSRALDGDGDDDLASLDYAYSVGKTLALGLRAGVLRERGGLLGSSGDGALSLSDSSMTRFVEGRFVKRMTQGVALIGEVGIGQTDAASGGSGYLSFNGPLTSVETRLGLALSDVGRKGDQLTISGGIPLHVVDGTATTRLPTGRDAQGNIAYTTSETALGDGIPLEMRLDYAVPLSERLTVGINSALRRDGAADVYGDVAVGMRLSF